MAICKYSRLRRGLSGSIDGRREEEILEIFTLGEEF
jgi:hypothetical protein